MKWIIVVLACIGLAAAASLTQFEADLAISNDPTIKGTMKGIIDFDFSGQTQSIRYDIGVQEIILYSSKIKYLVCTGACDAQTWTNPQNKYFSESGDTGITGITTRSGRTCNGFQKASGNVLYIYEDGSGPCRATLRDGTVYDFDNIRGLDTSQASAYTGKGCPAQQCGKQIDFVFVLDESGSITSSSFSYMKGFLSQVADSYSYGPLATAVGIVMFASTARVIINLSTDKSSVDAAISSIQQLGGNTCMGCGVQTGYNMYVNYARPKASKVMLFMTDGQNNRQTSSFTTVVTTAKNYGITIFAIGVGADADHNEIHYLASNVPGVQTEFYSPSYQQLTDIVNQLVIVTCVDIPGNPCGAGCQGFCSCGKTCVCPSSCEDYNPCTDQTCNPALAGGGCTYSDHNCDDSNACTTDTCNPATTNGCVHTTVSCTNPDPCVTPSCSPSVGCQYTAISCDDQNPCTDDTCNHNPGGGCVHTTIPCNKCQPPFFTTPCPTIACNTNECDPNTGSCKATPISCDDGNPCSDDRCDPNDGLCKYSPHSCDDGDACTVDFCDPKSGCQHTTVNATAYCNDNNACTIDTCNVTIGCVNTPIVCNDNLTCTTDTCNSLAGCQFNARDCSLDPSLPKVTGNCYVAACTEEKACYIKQFPGRAVDKCGVCDGDGKSCVHLNTAQAAGIAAGVLAAIIIGAIAVCAVLGAIGGKKGYDIYMRNRNNMTGANTNPLYTDNGLSGTNTMYSDDRL